MHSQTDYAITVQADIRVLVVEVPINRLPHIKPGLTKGCVNMKTNTIIDSSHSADLTPTLSRNISISGGPI